MTASAPLIPRPRAPGAPWYEAARVRSAIGGPPEFDAGVCFDALRLPAAAGLPLLAGTLRTGPVLRAGQDIWLLIAEGAAAEVPALLQWLEWGALAGALGLTAVGAGGRVPAPVPGGHGPWEAAVWLRPPAPGREGGRDLPAVVIGGHERGAPDLAALVDAAAAECHRALLRRQPLAFS